jgi:hypothetical protein
MVAISFIGRGNWSARKKHLPVASHWQTWSHSVVSSTLSLSGIRTHKISGDRLVWVAR